MREFLNGLLTAVELLLRLFEGLFDLLAGWLFLPLAKGCRCIADLCRAGQDWLRARRAA